MLSLQSMTILGLADDIFDIRWRHKVLLPAVASIPLLMVYYVDFNVTVIVTPTLLLRYFPLPHLIELGMNFLSAVIDGRVAVLCVHGSIEYLLHQHDQYSGWSQWT